MNQPDTKQRILDAAEHLFAHQGFNNTSLRAITGRAEVNLAAVNYHFGSKEALLDAVFERRLVPLNRIRRERLEAVMAAARQENRRPGVEELLLSFIEPTLSFRDSGPGAQDFIALVGRTIGEPDEAARKVFLRHIEPLFFLLLAFLEEALPALSREVLFWRLQFALGAMSHTMRMAGRPNVLPAGLIPSSDTDFLTDHLMAFITAGMKVPEKSSRQSPS